MAWVVFQAVEAADFPVPVAADFLVAADSAVAEVVKGAADFRAAAVDFQAVVVVSAAVVVAKVVVAKAVAEIVVNRPYCKIGSAYTLYYCVDLRS